MLQHFSSGKCITASCLAVGFSDPQLKVGDATYFLFNNFSSSYSSIVLLGCGDSQPSGLCKNRQVHHSRLSCCWALLSPQLMLVMQILWIINFNCSQSVRNRQVPHSEHCWTVLAFKPMLAVQMLWIINSHSSQPSLEQASTSQRALLLLGHISPQHMLAMQKFFWWVWIAVIMSFLIKMHHSGQFCCWASSAPNASWRCFFSIWDMPIWSFLPKGSYWQDLACRGRGSYLYYKASASYSSYILMNASQHVWLLGSSAPNIFVGDAVLSSVDLLFLC